MKRKALLYHIAGCIAFLVLPLLLSPRPPEETGNFLSRPTLRDLLANGFMLMFFYLNYYLLIPKIYFKKKYFLYGVILAVGFVIIILLPSLVTGVVPWQPEASNMAHMPSPTTGNYMPRRPSGSSFLEEIKHHIFLFAAVVLFSVLLQVQRKLLRSEKERLAAELSHLRAQVHPHFLFNTLNSIYALTIRKDDKAPDSIVKLSEFMRYLLSDANENEVLLQKELDYINNYLDLQRSRLRDSVAVHFQLNGNAGTLKIAPLLLFPFIENAFKHGVNPDEDSKIDIGIAIEGAVVRLHVENNKVRVRSEEFSNHVGLANTKNRLQLFYPERHNLAIDENESIFRITLKIDLA